MRLTLLLIIFAAISHNSSCEKNAAPGGIAADSMQIDRMGGFAGYHDHYLIANGKVMKDSNARDFDASFNLTLPKEKYDMVKGLLSAVPERMAKESGQTYGEMVYDGINYNVTAWYKGNVYRWTIKHNPPDYVQPFTEKLQEAFTKLQ
jgi:hypothetical protein